MKKPKINLNFSRYSDANLEIKTRDIVAAFAESPYYDKPTPTMAEMLDAISAFSDALIAAAAGDRNKIAEKNDRRRELEALLTKLAAYATLAAGGDKTKLASTSFDLERENGTKEVLPVEIVKVSSGANSGEVIVRVSGARGKKVYRYEYTPDPATDSSKWDGEVDTKAKHAFKGLPSGAKYCFRVAVIGNGGVTVYSHIVTYIVQ